MRMEKLTSHQDKVFSEDIKIAFKNGSDVTIKSGKQNAPTFRLYRKSDTLNISGEKQEYKDNDCTDMFYIIRNIELCRLSVKDPHGTHESFGVEFDTELYVINKRLLNLRINARFRENRKWNVSSSYGTLKPSMDVTYKFSEQRNKWHMEISCSSFRADDFQEVRKFACALTLVEKIVKNKMESIKDSIFDIAGLELCEQYK